MIIGYIARRRKQETHILGTDLKRGYKVFNNRSLSIVFTIALACCLFLAISLTAGCASKPDVKGGEGVEKQPANASAETELASNPGDGEQFLLTLDFQYIWTGPEGETIRWQADPGSNQVTLTASITPVTDTCNLSGDATLPVVVSVSMPEGAMTGSGTRNVDVGGPCENGVVKLTIMETTGGTYTISADGYSMTRSTPENILKYEMEFSLSDLVNTGKSTATVPTEFGSATGTLEPVFQNVPLTR
jgi:hypothetical protein